MADALDFEAQTYRTVTWRLLPFLFLCYILAYLDRVNVGFARLQMQADLGLSDTAYGIGAGMFFVGYFFFEVPSNLLMRRVIRAAYLGDPPGDLSSLENPQSLSDIARQAPARC